ncbi:hypothetical protein DQM23_05990 [Lacticaseibacillus paracasei]|nr:hypothetical protein LPEG9_09105 [Lacticaseibacillus paracasei]RDF91974.1 hypothetical protein DQM23_05990 [Lacticaseibacillus paracasei]
MTIRSNDFYNAKKSLSCKRFLELFEILSLRLIAKGRQLIMKTSNSDKQKKAFQQGILIAGKLYNLYFKSTS